MISPIKTKVVEEFMQGLLTYRDLPMISSTDYKAPGYRPNSLLTERKHPVVRATRELAQDQSFQPGVYGIALKPQSQSPDRFLSGDHEHNVYQIHTHG